MSKEPDRSPNSLVDELMSKLEFMTSGGPMVNLRALELELPQQSFATRQAYPFPRGELPRYLGAELKAYLRVEPLPQSVEELRQVLVHNVPLAWQSFLAGLDEDFHPPVEMPFPSDLVAGISQRDINDLHLAANIEAAPLGFDASDPLCYGWVAMQYFAVNLACAWPAGAGSPPLDLCGLPSDTGHRCLPAESVAAINRLLTSCSDDIRTPALFFLCSYAALMESSWEAIKDNRDKADDDLIRSIAWAHRMQDTIRDLLVEPDPNPTTMMRAHRARRLLAAPSSYLRLAVTREVNELLQIDLKHESLQQLLSCKFDESLGELVSTRRESLEYLLVRVDEIIDQAKQNAAEQKEVLASHGIVQRSRTLNVVRACALAIREVLSEGSVKGRGKPRKPVLQLLATWGVSSISDDSFDQLIRQVEQEA